MISPAPDALTLVSNWARRRRETGMAPDLPAALLVVRGDHPIALLEDEQPSTLVRASGFAAMGYGADALGLVVEGFAPRVAHNPFTGEIWEPGEIARVWEEYGRAECPWATEVLVVTVASRSGGEGSAAFAFQNQSDGIVWEAGADLAVSTPSAALALADALGRPAADPGDIPDPGELMVAPAGAPNFGAEEGRLVLDVGTTRVLDRQLPEGACRLLAFTDEEAERLLSHGVMAWQVERIHSTRP